MAQGWPSGVDLYLGSFIGLWVLDNVRPIEVGSVWTEDPLIAETARRRDIPVNDDSMPCPVVLSVHYPRILPVDRPSYNLHPGLLPHGRGYYPVFWALWDGEPAGATLHRMTERLDAGPIVDQRSVEIREDDTGGALHARVTEAEQDLFREWWPRLVWDERIAERGQPEGGSYHDLASFIALRDAPPPDVDRVRLARALTTPDYPLPGWAQAAS